MLSKHNTEICHRHRPRVCRIRAGEPTSRHGNHATERSSARNAGRWRYGI